MKVESLAVSRSEAGIGEQFHWSCDQYPPPNLIDNVLEYEWPYRADPECGLFHREIATRFSELWVNSKPAIDLENRFAQFTLVNCPLCPKHQGSKVIANTSGIGDVIRFRRLVPLL